MSRLAVFAAEKRYGTVRALDKVDLAFASGELFGLLGPSGSGKTTLLRAIAGFVDLDHGRIELDGVDISTLPVHRRRIGMMFQSYALFPHMTVGENIAFGLEMLGLAKAAIAGRVAAALDLVRLPGLETRRPRQLSGGQQQRVALARALVTEPKALLLDEPLSALDKHLREEMQVELRAIQRRTGITTIFVTHDQEEALTLSDRIAILDHGRLMQVGRPRDVYERPANRFAAAFLGEANFLVGRIEHRAGGMAVARLADGSEIGFAEDGQGLGENVMLALRPERIALARGRHATTLNSRFGRVAAVIFSGSSLTYRVESGTETWTVFARNDGTAPFDMGEEVTLSWQPEHLVPVAP